MDMLDPKQAGAREGGSFLSFKEPPHKHTVLLAGSFSFFRQVFDEATKEKAVFPADADTGTWRFRVNAIVPVKDSQPEVKILEGGVTVYKALFELNQEYPLKSTVIIISRSGSGLQTSYSCLPAKNQPNNETLKVLQSMELLELNPLKGDTNIKGGGSQPPQFSDDNNTLSDDEVPF